MSVIKTPAFSKGNLPFAKLSSITKYSGTSVFTKKAKELFPILKVSLSSKPKSFNFLDIVSEGRGVILSIILKGKETLFLSSKYSIKPSLSKPFFNHSFAIVIIASLSLSPLFAQLSTLNIEIG